MTTRSASRDASIRAKAPVPAATTGTIAAPFGGTPVPSVALAMACAQQVVVVVDGLVGLQPRLAHRAGGDGGHEVGVGHLDALDARQAQRPAQGDDRALVGLVVVAALVDADDDAAHRQPERAPRTTTTGASVWWMT